MRLHHAALRLALAMLGCAGAQIPAEHRADRDRMSRAFAAFSMATELTQPPRGQSTLTMPASRQDSVLMLIERGVAIADSIDIRFLAWLHPDLPLHFRQKLVEGHRLTVRGMRADNLDDQLRGGALIREWYDGFWSANGKAITVKALPQHWSVYSRS